MAAGDILKEADLVVEQFTVKASEDIEKGELCYDDGNGLLAATAAAAAGTKVVMALEAHDYSEVSTHVISCVVKGFVIAQKVSGSGAASKLDKITISGTAGEVTKFAKGTVSQANTFATATDQAAIDTNLEVIGFATKASLDADTVQEMYLGGA
ncbi:MAG: hypothetical protein IAX22_07785 [Candidatus Bathyarchaeota archaeon]|nr:hypothetical protein [Candidatus Bathyarchaeota archaeon]